MCSHLSGWAAKFPFWAPEWRQRITLQSGAGAFFPVPFGISVFNGNLIHLSPKKNKNKKKHRECCIRGVGQSLPTGILFQGWSLCMLRRGLQWKTRKQVPPEGLGGTFLRPQGIILSRGTFLCQIVSILGGSPSLGWNIHNLMKSNIKTLRFKCFEYLNTIWLFSEMGSTTHELLAKL